MGTSEKAGIVRFTMDERHERILELVKACGAVRLTELAEHLDISTVTARRDVDALAERGAVSRSRGMVSWPTAPTPAQKLQKAGQIAGQDTGATAEGPVLGMIVPQTRYYFGEIIRGAREAVQAVGGRLVLGITGYHQSPDVQVERMLESGVDGLLLTPNWQAGESAQDAGRVDFGMPAVLVERRGTPGTGAARLDRVCSNHAGGGGLAVEHLAGLGHRRIALVARPSPTQVQVQAGFDTALRTLGMDPGPDTFIEFLTEDPDPRHQEEAADRLAAAVRTREITAAVVVSDVEAITLVQLLQSRGLEVPHDLALVAYDDDVAALSDLPLTAIALPKYEVGRASAQLLLRRVAEQTQGASEAREGADPRQHLDLLPELRVRASCGAP